MMRRRLHWSRARKHATARLLRTVAPFGGVVGAWLVGPAALRRRPPRCEVLFVIIDPA
jgi:hypothetical protein